MATYDVKQIALPGGDIVNLKDGNAIHKSDTSGFVKNDGSIDQNTYQIAQEGKGLSTNDYDNTDKAKVDMIDNTTTSATGNPISIADLKSAQIALNPVITYNPIQDLHGQSKPYPAGGGKNKLNMADKTISGADWVFNKSACVLAAGTYIFSWNINVSTQNSCELQVYDSAGNSIIADVASNVQTPIQFTISQAAGYCRFYSATGGTFSKFMIRLSTESADYAPYENICPISGYDKIEVLSCGKNLLGFSNVDFTISNVNFKSQNNTVIANGTASTNISSTASDYKNNFKFTLSAGTYYFSINTSGVPTVRMTSDDTVIVQGNGTFTLSQKTELYLGIYIQGNTVFSLRDLKINLTIGSTATTYEPYHKTTDLSESLGQTLYRFTEDVRSGKITTQYVYTTFSGASDETIERVGTNISGKWRFVLTKTGLVTIPWSDGTHKSNMLTTNILDEVTNTDTNACTVGIHYRANGGGNSFIAYFGDNYTTVDDVKALLQTTPLQVVYAVPTVTTIQHTPHEIALSQGYNYISTNGSQIQLSYHNGEVATHADVEQLAETVALLDRPPIKKGEVNILSYNTSSNRYTFPSDGYVHMYVIAGGTGCLTSNISDTNGTFLCAINLVADANYNRFNAIFVKKGMKVFSTIDATTISCGVLFQSIG